jgi:hypothetical protein
MGSVDEVKVIISIFIKNSCLILRRVLSTDELSLASDVVQEGDVLV